MTCNQTLAVVVFPAELLCEGKIRTCNQNMCIILKFKIFIIQLFNMLHLIPLIIIPGKGLPTWCRHLWNKKSQRCSKFVNETGIALFHPHIEEKHNAYKVSLTMSHLQVIFGGSGITASALMPALPMLWRSRFQSKITQVCISKISTSRQFRIYLFTQKL